MSELDAKLASATCQDISMRMERSIERMERQGDRVANTEAQIERLSTLVTVHAERDEDRWRQSRDEHSLIWKAIQSNDERLERLMTKDRMFGMFGNVVLVLTAGAVSGVAVWLLGG